MKIARQILFGTLLFLVLTFNTVPVCALDNLILTGIVKALDYREGTITIDVKSSQCPGIRVFKVDDISRLNNSFIGRRFTFAIESPNCKEDRIYIIRLPR